MEKVLTPESVMVLVVMLMPGFIYGRVKRWVTQRIDDEKPSVANEVYANLVRSLVMLMLVFPWGFGRSAIHHVFQAMSTGALDGAFTSFGAVLMYAVLLIIGPALLGGLMGVLEVNEVTGWMRRKFRLPPVVLNQAWDVAMSRASAEKGLILAEVALKNGETILGRYGPDSAASRSGGYRDLYLQEIWVGTNGALAPGNAGSILIRGSDIRSVRFIRIPE